MESAFVSYKFRDQELAAGDGRTLFLTGAKENEILTRNLQDRLEKRGFTVLRVPVPGTFSQTTAAIVVLSSDQNPWFDTDLQTIRETQSPLLIIALQAFEVPPCLAAYRCPPNRDPADLAIAWLLQTLDRPQLPLDHGALPAVASAFWNRRLALAANDLQHAARSVFPLIGGAGFYSAGVAISSNVVIAPITGVPPTDLKLRLDQDKNYLVEQIGQSKEIAVFRSSSELPNFLRLAQNSPSSPLIAVLSIDGEQKVSVCPGWLTSARQSELAHDAASTSPGVALVSLETGELLGINVGPGYAFPAGLIRTLLPPDAVTTRSTELESVQESVLDDSLERVKATPEDYANRNGYDPNFLGAPVPLPKTNKKIALLPYANFSVVLSSERRLTLYAVVNINGKNLVDKHRAGDPWQLDPRVPEDAQVGGKYYAGTPLDRGHMVRRVDPVWGNNADQAERDTFHYPNSCPQHKNLNRKTWNDLEDYIYANLQRDDMKVTVFTGPVLAGDDDLFHGLQLPKEFWKVVVIRRDDGKLSATAYLLSQEDMIEGLEFVFGEFRTYQVSIALIEKKTGLDFGNLRTFDPRAKKTALEAVESAAAEIRGPQDIDLDLGPAPALAAAAPAVMRSVWQDTADGERRLNDALNTFDWSTTDQLNDDLIAALTSDPSKFDELFARRVLSSLQRKRRFGSMIRLGDAFLQQGFAGPQIRRRYAQALIEQGSFIAADLVLRNIIDDASALPGEKYEAQGLLGRIGKQIYVNANAPENEKNVARLQNAVDSYWVSYTSNPNDNYWHGINVVACLRRAKRDGIELRSPADPQELANDILKNLQNREEQSTRELLAFELATFVEAHVALGQFPEAVRRAKVYVGSKDADAFEVASTLRQLEEVWKLGDDPGLAGMIVTFLHGELLHKQGGSLQLSPSAVHSNLQAQSNLEKVFGDDSSMSLQWYMTGLERAKSIARIERNDKGFGTGWVVNAADLFSGGKGLLLITNAHVIGPESSDRYPGSLRPEEAKINFQFQKQKVSAGKIVFHSPVDEFDATILELPQVPPDAVALPLDPNVLKMATPPQRLYIIGYPGGRDLEFSLQDNHLLAASERKVHYRTPSEGGSSGSPVFGPINWNVVALHHAGRKDMPRLDGQAGTYEANEGIALAALTKKTSGR